jgi:hypothetical protein
MSATQHSALAGYDGAKFTTIFPRADASPDTARGWIRSWFTNRAVKFPMQQAGMAASHERDLQTSIEKIAWDGKDIRLFTQDTMESDMRCWGFGDAYSRMVTVFGKLIR